MSVPGCLQVYIVQLQFFQACGDGVGDVCYVGDDFGGDEEFLSRGFGLFDGYAELFLVVVCFGSIEVIVSESDGRLYTLDQLAIYRAVV